MKILDRYILNEFFRAFLRILAVLTVFMTLRQILRELSEILLKEPPPLQVLLYFVYNLPSEILFSVPITIILAIMFSLGSLSKNKELLAIHASGVSYLRIALPLGGVLVLVTLMTYIGNETLVPTCRENARYIKQIVFEGKETSTLTRNRNIVTKGAKNRFYTMKNFDSGSNIMQFPTITELTPDGRTILTRLDAKSAQLVEKDGDGGWREVKKAIKDQNYWWRFDDAEFFEFDKRGLANRSHYDVIRVEMEENLDRFLNTSKKSSHMSIWSLYELVSVEAQRGKGDLYNNLKTKLHGRLAFPMAAFLLGMLGYTFAVRSSIRSLVFEFGMALLSILIYYALFAVFEDLGKKAIVPPLLASWATNILFTLVLIWRFRRLEQVPG